MITSGVNRTATFRWQNLIKSKNVQSEEDHTLALENAEAVHEALRRLSVEHREVLVLYFLQDLKIDEIAQVTGVKAGTIKSRLHYARRALRMALECEGPAMNDVPRDFADRLLRCESHTPEYREKYEKEVSAMLVKKLGPFGRAMWVFLDRVRSGPSRIVQLCGRVHLWPFAALGNCWVHPGRRPSVWDLPRLQPGSPGPAAST